MTSHLMTDAEMAERIGKSRWFVQERCRGEEPDWPHLRVGKSVRFTSEQVEAIDALLTVEPTKPADPASSWGRRGRSAS